MTKLDLDRLRQIANMATQGEWIVKKTWKDSSNDAVTIRDGYWFSPGHYPKYLDDELGEDYSNNDAEHIATFNPQTVLALIELIEEAEVLLTTVPDGYYTDAWLKKAGFKE